MNTANLNHPMIDKYKRLIALKPNGAGTLAQKLLIHWKWKKECNALKRQIKARFKI